MLNEFHIFVSILGTFVKFSKLKLCAKAGTGKEKQNKTIAFPVHAQENVHTVVTASRRRSTWTRVLLLTITTEISRLSEALLGIE